MSTHKITPDTVLPKSCWLKYVDRVSPTDDEWNWADGVPGAQWALSHGFHYYSTNPPDQMPEDVPADHSYEQLKADIAAARKAERAHRKAGSDLATPPAPDSLQAVAEKATQKLVPMYYESMDTHPAGTLATAKVAAERANVSRVLIEAFAPLLARRDEELRQLKADLDTERQWAKELAEAVAAKHRKVVEKDEELKRVREERECHKNECEHQRLTKEAYVRDVELLRARLAEVEAQLAEAKEERDEAVRPWNVELSLAKAGAPFDRWECRVVDVGHADRVLVVECPEATISVRELESRLATLEQELREAREDRQDDEKLLQHFADHHEAEYLKVCAAIDAARKKHTK